MVYTSAIHSGTKLCWLHTPITSQKKIHSLLSSLSLFKLTLQIHYYYCYKHITFRASAHHHHIIRNIPKIYFRFSVERILYTYNHKISQQNYRHIIIKSLAILHCREFIFHIIVIEIESFSLLSYISYIYITMYVM